VFAAEDILEPTGQTSRALDDLCNHLIPSFPADAIELTIVHPLHPQRFEWTDVPSCIKQFAEMRFHGVGKNDVYGIYGVEPRRGAIAVVRPDGYVGIVTHLADTRRIDSYLRRCLVSSSGS
jgi:phenol 2-monooxygenase